MLRIIQNQAAASAKTYYSPSAYYSEGQELGGMWGGQAAKRLGLAGAIAQPDFDALCDNLNPSTGRRLTARTKSNRTVGYDFNFHVPKGVSLAYALGGDERILTAFEDCGRETMDDVERDAETRVRVSNRQQDRITGNLVWGEFIHKTARPVNGLPDAHLHAHYFVFNVTHDDSENRFKAAQFRHLKQDAAYYEALFHSRLARRMRALGYTIERTGRHWDIAEILRSMRDKFSRRRDQIEELARAKGISDAAEKSELGARSRERKLYDSTMSELRRQWLERLSHVEIATLAIPIASSAQILDHEEANAATAAVQQAISHCFERSAVVPERHVIAEALRRGIGKVRDQDIPAAAVQQGLIVRHVNGRPLATTPEAISDEQAAVEFVRRGRNSVAPLNEHWAFERKWLSDEQQRAVAQLTQSRDRVQVLHGGAGTGKTALMQEAAAAIESGGKQLFTFAPSAQASRGVLRDEGFSNATTVAELLVNESLQQDAAGQVWWIDEAGLLSTKQLKQVTELAARLDARLILSGDWRQHASVERGGLLRQLVMRSGIKAAELGSIRRQQGSYKAAVKAIAAGDIAGGFDQLDRLGWIQELPDDERNDQIASEYAAAIAAGESCLVVAPTNWEAEHLTFSIRRRLHDQASLEGSTAVRRLQPLHLTESERRDPAFYLPSDVIEFHQNAAGHRKGERVAVAGRPACALLQQASRFSVYRSGALSIAAGERIRFTANVKTIDGKHRLNNGAVYTVAGATRGGDLRLSNGWVVGRDVGHIAYGYVTTSHGSQGRTVDRILLAESAESLPAAGAEQFYVSISRGRKRATVYTDDKRALRTAVQESRTGLTAFELASLQQRQQATAAGFRARQRLMQSTPATMESSHSHLLELAYGNS